MENNFTLGSHTLFVTYTKQESVVNRWLQDHVNEKTKLIGFDTESRPQFKKGMSRNKIATIQLAVITGHCLVYHIIKDHGASLEELQSVLGNSQIKKVGAAIQGDISCLNSDYSLHLRSIVDISKVVKAYKGMIKDMYHLSLMKSNEDAELIEDPVIENEFIRLFTKKLEVLYFEKIGIAGISQALQIPFSKSKKISISNWENCPLTNSQLHYAAADSWIVINAYERLSAQLASYAFPKNHVSKIMDLLN